MLTVGTSLLAMAVVQPALMLTDIALSRASSLPQGVVVWVGAQVGQGYFCAVALSQLGILNTQNEPPWATGLVSSAMSPPHNGTAPP